MADEQNMVDSMDAQQTAEQSATQENHPAGGSSPKMFTAAEVDAQIKARIDKQRAKYEQEIETLRGDNAKLQSDLDAANGSIKERERLDALSKSRDAIAKEFGMDSSVVFGETEEEMRKNAEAVKAYADGRAARYTPFRDSGSTKKVQTQSEKAQFVHDLFNKS